MLFVLSQLIPILLSEPFRPHAIQRSIFCELLYQHALALCTARFPLRRPTVVLGHHLRQPADLLAELLAEAIATQCRFSATGGLRIFINDDAYTVRALIQRSCLCQPPLLSRLAFER